MKSCEYGPRLPEIYNFNENNEITNIMVTIFFVVTTTTTFQSIITSTEMLRPMISLAVTRYR